MKLTLSRRIKKLYDCFIAIKTFIDSTRQKQFIVWSFSENVVNYPHQYFNERFADSSFNSIQNKSEVQI